MPTLEQLKGLYDQLRKDFDALKKVIDDIRLPGSWRFQFPVSFITASFPEIDPAADGDYLVIPRGDGPPTGTPKTAGALYWDYTNFDLYGWTGSAWKSVSLS